MISNIYSFVKGEAWKNFSSRRPFDKTRVDSFLGVCYTECWIPNVGKHSFTGGRCQAFRLTAYR